MKSPKLVAHLIIHDRHRCDILCGPVSLLDSESARIELHYNWVVCGVWVGGGGGGVVLVVVLS